MCKLPHKLRNVKNSVGLTFTWSNEAFLGSSGLIQGYMNTLLFLGKTWIHRVCQLFITRAICVPTHLQPLSTQPFSIHHPQDRQ